MSAVAGFRLRTAPLTLELRDPLRLAHGVSSRRTTFWLRLDDDAGWGEATIPPYYRDVRSNDITAFFATAVARAADLPEHAGEIARWVGTDGPAPARSALDLALHDRIGRTLGLPLYRLLELPAPQPRRTAVTLGIDSPEAMARRAARFPEQAVLKLKLGGDPLDVARVVAVREARPSAELYLDANGAWTREEAVERLRALAGQRVTLAEEPVRGRDIDGLAWVQERVDIPIVADESAQSLGDIDRLARGGVRGVNLKLMKLGGIAPTLEALRRARELGLSVMLGCMIESSLGVTAMAHLSGLADWIDLDAPLLLRNDPFVGVRFDEDLRVHVSEASGTGVSRRPPAVESNLR